MAGGRKTDEAPEGHKTVSEAAAILGLSTTAIRQMIHREQLPFMMDDNGEAVRTDSGESRYYIPTDAVQRELERRKNVATGGDLERLEGQLEGHAAAILAALLSELSEHDQRVQEKLSELAQLLIDGIKERGGQFQEMLDHQVNIENELKTIRRQNERYHREALELMRPREGFRQRKRRRFFERMFGE